MTHDQTTAAVRESLLPRRSIRRGHEPGPHQPDWIDFLWWLADYASAGAGTGIVIRCVEKPWKFTDAYSVYRAAGGTSR